MSNLGGRGVPVAARTTQMRLPRPHRQLFRQPWDVLAVIAAGGAIGAFARYSIGLAWPTPLGGFPKATLIVNLLGCALIGVLMVFITDVWAARRLIRPFLGTGVLGGFTTFSTYAVEVQRLVESGAARTGLLYLVLTPFAALAAVSLGVVLTRQAVRRETREAHR